MSAIMLSAKPIQSQAKGEIFQKEGSLVAAGSIDFIIPDSVEKMGVQVVPSGGASATVYATENSVESVNAGTASFLVWDNGTVTSLSQALCSGVATVIRITQSGTGSVKYAICAK